MKVVLQPLAQEMNAFPCDIGTDREELMTQVKERKLWGVGLGVSVEKVVFDEIEDGWNVKVSGPESILTGRRCADEIVGGQVGAR